MNLYSVVNDWLKGYEKLGSWIYFNATPIISGAVAMNTVPGDRVTKYYITGAKQKELIFAIDMVTEYDNSGTSDINMIALDEVNNFTEWLDEKALVKDYPDFGQFNSVESIEVLTNIPSMLVNTDNMLAKYQVQVKIVYLDESEVN